MAGISMPQRRQAQTQTEDPLDKVMKGLQIAGSVFGIYSDLTAIKSRQEEGARAAEATERERTKFKQDQETFARQKKGIYSEPEFAKLVTSGWEVVEPPSGPGTSRPDIQKFTVETEGEDGKKSYRNMYAIGPKISAQSFQAGEAEKNRADKARAEEIKRQDRLNELDKKYQADAAKLAQRQAERAEEKREKALKEGKKLPPAVEKQVDGLVAKNVNFETMESILSSYLDEFDRAETDEQKFAVGQQMIKPMNSIISSDAVSVDERRVLSPFLEFAKGNIFNSNPVQFGRNFPAFRKQVESNIAALRKTIAANNSKIMEISRPYSGLSAPTQAAPPAGIRLPTQEAAPAQAPSPAAPASKTGASTLSGPDITKLPVVRPKPKR